jgi:hypothetical protein
VLSMPVDQAVFLRIDTADGSPYLEGSSGEIAVAGVLSAQSKGLYDLLGFVVLPNELQLLIVPHGKSMNDVFKFLDAEIMAQVQTVKPVDKNNIFDADYYREKIDSNDEIRQRLRWMYASPVRSRLTTNSSAYPYSSANERFRGQLPLANTLN